MQTYHAPPGAKGKTTPRTAPAGGNSRLWAGLAILLLLLLTGVIAAFYRWCAAAPRERLELEPNVVVGAVPGQDPAARRAELDRTVEKGMLAISINATPFGKEGGRINWLIENPENQGKYIRVEVQRQDTGELIYKTGALRPGTYVEAAEPDTELAAGEYACTAIFYSYELESEEYIGKAAAEITLTIQPGEGAGE